METQCDSQYFLERDTRLRSVNQKCLQPLRHAVQALLFHFVLQHEDVLAALVARAVRAPVKCHVKEHGRVRER